MKVSKFLKCLQINKFLNKTALKQFAVFYPSKPNTGFTTRGNMHLNHLVVNGNTSLRSARKLMNLHRKFMGKNVTVIGRQNNMKMQASLHPAKVDIVNTPGTNATIDLQSIWCGLQMSPHVKSWPLIHLGRPCLYSFKPKRR